MQGLIQEKQEEAAVPVDETTDLHGTSLEPSVGANLPQVDQEMGDEDRGDQPEPGADQSGQEPRHPRHHGGVEEGDPDLTLPVHDLVRLQDEVPDEMAGHQGDPEVGP